MTTLTTPQIETIITNLTHKQSLLSNITTLYKTLNDQFTSFSNHLDERTKTLDCKYQNLTTDTILALDALKERENSISVKEAESVNNLNKIKQLTLENESRVENDNKCQNEKKYLKESVTEVMKFLCRRMDWGELVRVMVKNRKELGGRSFGDEVLSECVDGARLVLEVVEGYIGCEGVGVKGMSLGDMRWACGVLMKGLFSEGKRVRFGKEIEEKAREIGEKWRGKIGDGDALGAEAEMVLLFVVGFGLKEKFEDEWLRKLVVDSGNRKEVPKIAVGLWSRDQMAGIIHELVKKGNEVAAVYFAHESNQTDRFLPVPLLKAHLENAKRSASKIMKDGHYSFVATEEANNLELNAIKAIIKSIEDYKLQTEFPLGSLRKRVSQLEKAKAEKKKTTQTNKRRREVGGQSGSRSSKVGRASTSYHANRVSPHQNAASMYAGTAAYNYPNQPVYSHAPPTLTPTTRPPTSYGVQANYGAYDYSAVAAPRTTPATSNYNNFYLQ